MSIMVMCRNLVELSDFEASVSALADLRKSASFIEAINYWGGEPDACWTAITSLKGRSWDGLVRRYVQSESEHHLDPIIRALRRLADKSDEIAIWYSGFPDEIEVFRTSELFCQDVTRQLRDGSDEPSCRMKRSV